MIAPLKITAFLASQVAGDSFYLDSILSYELAMRMGLAYKVTRDNPLTDESDMPIPIYKTKIQNLLIWHCSDAIFKPEIVEIIRHTKRFPSDDSLLLNPKQRKSILTASGPYKMQFKPIPIFSVSKIVWFANGDKKEIWKLLKKITAIGKNRNMGFGKVYKWEIEKIENDYSLVAENYLMKTVPIEFLKDKTLSGYRISYGGYKPPYWHPDNYREIAMPC